MSETEKLSDNSVNPSGDNVPLNNNDAFMNAEIGVEDDDTGDLEEDLTLTEFVHEEIVRLINDPRAAERWKSPLRQIDAVCILGEDSCGHLPTLHWNTSFRKSYTILFWIRPILVTSTHKSEVNVESIDSHEDQESNSQSKPIRRIWYRFSSSPDDHAGVGICVQSSEWILQSDGTIHTTLTAFGLPPKTQLVQCPMYLIPNEWSLIAFSHTFPYLKRPQWTVSVNGNIMARTELQYPVVDQPLQHSTVLENLCVGGVRPFHDSNSDDAKPASTLTEKNHLPSYSLHFQLATIALHCESISTEIISLLYCGGPALSLQQYGRIVTPLPPIDNWTKGSSLNGPNIGIPLAVHPVALEVQHLVDSVVHFFAATNSKVLRGRILFQQAYLPGESRETPKVGLLQPSVVQRDEDLPVLNLVGNVHLIHALSDFLLQSNNSRVNPNLVETSKNLSIVLLEQGLLPALVLPLFLALLPSGQHTDLQKPLVEQSNRFLFNLYSNKGQWAARLIQLFADVVYYGGARVHEQVLQHGLIHVIASCLRLGLLRAQHLHVQNFDSIDKFMNSRGGPAEDAVLKSMHDSVCPASVPQKIAQACSNLVAVCCGITIEIDFTPSTRLQRSSDMALTAVFGLALNLDLWGKSESALLTILTEVCWRYGNVQGGQMLRRQVPIQSLLDCLRSRLEFASHPEISARLGDIVQHMLLASLSHRRNISIGEHDIAACMSALSDCPLGSVGTHVILSSLKNILEFCHSDDEQLVEIATRMGRNLIINQYHDVIAPMLLSRTVFCGERTMSSPETKMIDSRWQNHWRMAMTLFVWVTSISGPEGISSSQSTGGLLLASGLAGSLKNCLVDEHDTQSLWLKQIFLPHPTMALMIGSQGNADSWSYSDLLSDRLQVMMPLLPGLVMSLVCDEDISNQSLQILSDLFASISASLHRVLGVAFDTLRPNNYVNKLSPGKDLGNLVDAATDYLPQLTLVSVLLEHHIRKQEGWTAGEPPVVFQPVKHQTSNPHGSEGEWVDVPPSPFSEDNSDFVLDAHLTKQQRLCFDEKLKSLQWSQKSALSLVTDLIGNVMNVDEGEMSTNVWRSVIATLDDASSYIRDRSSNDVENLSRDILCRLVAIVLTKAQSFRMYDWEMWSSQLCRAIARMCNMVEEKNLLVTSNDEPLSQDQILLQVAILDLLLYGREMTGWCQLIFPTPPESLTNNPDFAEDEISFNQTQATEYVKSSEKGNFKDHNKLHRNFVPPEIPGASSKIMLPILQPAFRVTMATLEILKSHQKILIPDTGAPDSMVTKQLILHVGEEVRLTLVAGIVGLSFANAREMALHGMTTLRRLLGGENLFESETRKYFASFLCDMVEEIRARYEGERRRREKALFDAYDDADTANREAAASQEVERIILGGALIPGEGTARVDESEEITFGFQNPPFLGDGNEDFVMFHEDYTDGETSAMEKILTKAGGGAQLGWDQFKGFGTTLEECSVLSKSGRENDPSGDVNAEAVMFLKILGPYLDTWDARTLEEDEDQRMFRLYDQSAFERDNNDDFLQNENNISHPRSEAAADAMSTYIEIASSEKARLSDFVNTFLPSLRFSCQAYTERYCWSRYFETLNNNDACGMSQMWERGISDGNRDIRSRLVTMPCHPQFKRYIPKYLDHAIEQVDDVSIPAPSLEPERSAIGEISAPSNVMSNTDLLSDTLRTLVQTGNLEIVDVTKKSVDEEEHLKLSAIPLVTEGEIDDLEDDIYGDGSLGFPSRDEDNNNIHENASSDAATAHDTEESESGITATRVSEKIQGTGNYYVASSIYGHPPDNSTSVSSLRHSFGPEMIEKQFDNCLHVRAEGSRKCFVLLSQTHVILEYDSESAGLYEGELMAVREEVERQKLIKECGGPSQQVDRDGVSRETIQDELERRLKETASLRPKSIRWNLSELSHVYLRRCRLRDSALEMFFIPSGGSSFGGFGLYSPSTSLFLDFGSGHDGNRRRDDAASSIMKRAPPQTIKQWPDRSGQFLHEQLSRLTMGWVDGRITNFDYLLHLNMLAGRSYNDLTQYPVMPWVLSNYVSEEIPDLTDPNNFRDLTKPVGALNPDRLRDFLERYETFADPTIPAFMYGSHYSTSAGVVYHFLVRMHPFAGLHRQLQGGYFDVADRLFSSVPRTWDMCTGYSAAEVKELTPEWYCNPAFLKNTNSFKLGTSQDGELLGDVILPPWAKKSPEIFVEVMRNALESDLCSEMLPDWIDLIFGRKQQGPEAIKAHNVFFYLTYYGSVDVASIEDEGLREATELQIAHFGQCPMQLFVRPHVRRVQKTLNFRKLSFYQLLSANAHGAKHPSDGIHRPYTTKLDGSMRLFGEPLYLPFFTAPQSHWVHLDAPPPGPHANLIAVRLAGVDRCVAIDSAGIYHSFRWAWKPDETVDEQSSEPGPIDRGNFIAQRELPRFRTVPRLIYSQSTTDDRAPAVAISKTLFASRSVLLVLSDGDGCGGLAMQLIDPSKGTVKAEAMVPSAHSSRVTCIAMDPIGTAAGHGGVGGELAIVGSADGGTTLWRFMSSHYLPLRPRIRMRGHCGSRVQAVALSSAIHICASVSREKCCIFSIGNGAMIHSWPPPDVVLPMITEGSRRKTIFCDTPALGLSVQGFVVTVCKTFIESDDGMSSRNVITLHLFSLEGVSLGSKALESWRGIPHKIACTPDGTAITVCHGRGVTIHRLSAITPLEYIDEWHTTESDELDETTPAAWDVDFGPSLMRPIVAAAACSSGVLRLHALPGISAWSERHRKSSIGIGMSFSKPVGRLRDVVGKFVGVSKDVGKEVSSEVRERGVGGFLAGTLFRKNAK